MLAAPLIFLADAITGSAVGKAAFWFGLASVPVLIRKKEAAALEEKYGFLPSQEMLIYAEQAKQRGGGFPSALEATLGEDVPSLVQVPEDVLPTKLKQYAGDYVLTASERIELGTFLVQAQADIGEGQQGELFRRMRIGANFFVGPDDFAHLQAKVKLLKDYYTPLRLKDPRISKVVEEQKKELAPA